MKHQNPPNPKPQTAWLIISQINFYMFVRYVNNTVVYPIKLAIMDVQLGGHLQKDLIFYCEAAHL